MSRNGRGRLVGFAEQERYESIFFWRHVPPFSYIRAKGAKGWINLPKI